jgi:hypothetical protein
VGPEGLALISVLKMDSEILRREIILKLFCSALFQFHISVVLNKASRLEWAGSDSEEN